MKVKLKVNLKVSSSQTETVGTIYEGTAETLPAFVLAELNDPRIFEIIDFGTKVEVIVAPSEPVVKPGEKVEAVATKVSKRLIKKQG